jgi:polyisoprenoid-binding protein YceI
MRPLFAMLALALSTPAFATTYEVDGAHSQIGFSVTHMMVSTARGTFGTVSGTVEWDPKNVAATKVSGKVDISSVDTNNADRDTHLKSPEFFDVAQFPEMTLVSKSVKNIKATGFDLVTDLTLHGVTKEVVFHVNTLSGEFKDPWGNIKVGTVATAKINRQDFGVSWNKGLDQGGYIVGDEVSIQLDLELLKK